MSLKHLLHNIKLRRNIYNIKLHPAIIYVFYYIIFQTNFRCALHIRCTFPIRHLIVFSTNTSINPEYKNFNIYRRSTRLEVMNVVMIEQVTCNVLLRVWPHAIFI